jgi:O-antigen/teichoic acid export membrane protein
MIHPAKRVAINTGFLYARMAITIFISLYSTRLVLAALGATDFGLFNVVGGAIAMLTFLNNAMTAASQRFMSYAQGEGNVKKQKSIFNVSIILHVITALLIVILLEVAGYFLFNGILKIPLNRIDAAKLIYHFLVVSTFFTIISVPYDAVINAHENMFLVAILGILEAILKLCIAIFITYKTSDKLIIYGVMTAFISIILMLSRAFYCHLNYSEVKIGVFRFFEKSLFKEMTSFASWSFLGATSSMIGYYGQGIVLNTFFGTIVNAAQGISSQVAGQLGSFSNTMLKALNPLIVKSEGAGNRDLVLKASSVGSKISFFLFMFFVIPVFIEMPFIFNLWLKNVPEYSIIFCRLFLIRLIIDQINISLPSLIAAVGNIKKHQMIISIFYVIPLIIAFILFKFGFPPYVLYVVFIIFAIFIGYINIYFAELLCALNVKVYLIDVIFRLIISLLFVSLLSYIPLFFMKEGYFRLIIVLIINFITFIFAIMFVGFNRNERNYFILIIKSTFKNLWSKMQIKTYS